GDKAVRFQPVRDPCRLISVRGGILGDGLSRCVLQRVLVSCQELFQILGIVLIHMRSKVIVDPASVTAYFIAKPLVLADQSLADEIVFNIKSPAVSDCHGIGAGGYVNRIRSLLEQTPCIHLLEGLDSSV